MKTYSVYDSSITLRELSMLEVIKPGDYINVKGNSWTSGFGFIELPPNSVNIGLRVHATSKRKKLGLHFFRPIP